jgi:hypothetical protein
MKFPNMMKRWIKTLESIRNWKYFIRPYDNHYAYYFLCMRGGETEAQDLGTMLMRHVYPLL